jgi:heme-degrading monooxygenase HmoA
MTSPYYAVIFTNLQSSYNEGYTKMAESMERLSRQQPGFLDFEHAREDIGISISYWESLEAIAGWKANLEHLEAQKLGKERWYDWYKIRICIIEREYSFARHNSKD